MTVSKRFLEIMPLALISTLLLLAACGAQAAPTSTASFTLVPSLTASSEAAIQQAVNGTLTAVAVLSTASATPPPDFTLTPIPTLPVTKLPPTTGDKIPPPFDITLPEGWQFGYDAQILPDTEQGSLIAIPVAAYSGPITGGSGTIVVYWGFPNLVTPSQEDLAQAALGLTPQATPVPDLWSDGVRLLRSGIVETDCNIGVDVRRSFRVGLLPAVGTLQQAHQIIFWYTYRWLIERFHYVLKSGCKLEERQLRQVQRLERLLAVYSLVAWKLLWLTYQARQTPDAPCTVILQPVEWQALYAFTHRTTHLPITAPTLEQAVRWIWQLGGFLGRKGDGQPGVKVLWRGWTRLRDIADTWAITHPTPTKDVGNV